MAVVMWLGGGFIEDWEDLQLQKVGIAREGEQGLRKI